MGRVLGVVLHILLNVSNKNRGHSQPEGIGLDFEGVHDPDISLRDYAQQIWVSGDESIWIVVLLLLQRLQESANLYVSPGNAHRLLLVTYVIALKLTHDVSRINKRVPGGVDLDDLCEMETSFLQLVDWHVHIDPSMFKLCAASLGAVARCHAVASEVPAPIIPEKVLCSWKASTAGLIASPPTSPRRQAAPRSLFPVPRKSQERVRRRTSRLHAALAQTREQR
eukprot:TRINITY_DN43857_c0_g1_i1.p1 TRINITY_DN43857_c0_g1~~TRINITY_DN43857_c0_g1_i1.p1  ORF type:complete len:224 (+),score=37.44 TRINITY_DN43857_c0_g1_i1:81-752(+)